MTEDQCEYVQYVGDIHPNCDYHHGQIFPAKGVKCYQVVRANRHNPQLADGTTTTYKHAPDLAYFNGRFYILYLCNPKDEHSGAGFSVLISSIDGINFSDPVIAFPEYKIPAVKIKDYKGNEKEFDGTSYAYMHQRTGFYRSSTGRMLLLGFYGWSPEKWITNWDNYGIGRVVRELYKDGTMSDIYFIRPNKQSGFRTEDLNYPLYDKSSDKGFIEACKELLCNKLAVQQWAEENGDIDPIISIKHPSDATNQAFCYYHINENEVVGLWKHSRTARSHDGGENWTDIIKSPSLVMSGQKIWAQKTSDGRYASVYDPTLETEHRYPMCITTSDDGIHYDNMRLVHGEVPPMRYAGFWKDLGPQYMRGIQEGILTESNDPGGDMYVTYSVNKEDIWFSCIPIPVKDEEKREISHIFNDVGSLKDWNIYKPKWADIIQENDGIIIKNREPLDYVNLERVMMPAKERKINIVIRPEQISKEGLYIELADRKGIIAVQLILRENGHIYVRTVTELSIGPWKNDDGEGKKLSINIEIDCKNMVSVVEIIELATEEKMISEKKEWRFRAAVNEVSRFRLRDGRERKYPTLDTVPEDIADTDYEISEAPIERSRYIIYKFDSI